MHDHRPFWRAEANIARRQETVETLKIIGYECLYLICRDRIIDRLNEAVDRRTGAREQRKHMLGCLAGHGERQGCEFDQYIDIPQ